MPTVIQKRVTPKASPHTLAELMRNAQRLRVRYEKLAGEMNELASTIAERKAINEDRRKRPRHES
jgi:hypothetical protein